MRDFGTVLAAGLHALRFVEVRRSRAEPIVLGLRLDAAAPAQQGVDRREL